MSRHAITFTPHSTGDLLTEVTRACALHANPSSLLARVEAGIALAIGQTHDEETRAFLEILRRTLETMALAWRMREDAYFSVDAPQSAGAAE